jgi:hypothetical protein
MSKSECKSVGGKPARRCEVPPVPMLKLGVKVAGRLGDGVLTFCESAL